MSLMFVAVFVAVVVIVVDGGVVVIVIVVVLVVVLHLSSTKVPTSVVRVATLAVATTVTGSLGSRMERMTEE